MSRDYMLDLVISSVKPDKELGKSNIRKVVNIARAIRAEDAGCIVVWDEECA